MREELFVVVDRTTSDPNNKARITESISLSIKHGHGIGEVRDQKGKHVYLLYEGFRSPINGSKFANRNPFRFFI